MNIELLLSFMFIAFLGAMIPGPNSLLIASHSVMHGKRGGFITLAGTLFAFYVHGFFSIIGLSALVLSSAAAFTIVKWLGVVYLLYLGFSSIIQAMKMESTDPVSSRGSEVERKSKFRMFALGFTTNVLNPKVSLFYLAVFPQFLSSVSNIVSTTIFLVTLQVLVVGLWFSFVVLVSSGIHIDNNIHMMKCIKGTVGSLMLWFGFSLARTHAST